MTRTSPRTNTTSRRDLRQHRDLDNLADARRLRQEVVRVLRMAKGFGSSKLAEEIEDCRITGRCGSGVCPECQLPAQGWYVAAVAEALGGAATLAVTVELRDQSLPVGGLLDADTGKLVHLAHQRVVLAGLAYRVTVGPIAWSANSAG